MPGENLIANASAGWTGPEAVAFGGAGVLLVVLALVVWKHLGECKRETAAMRAELGEVKLKLAALATAFDVLRDQLALRDK